MTPDTRHLTPENSRSRLLLFGIEGGLKIWRKRVTLTVSLIISDKGVFRAAPATPGLLITGLKCKCMSKNKFPQKKGYI